MTAALGNGARLPGCCRPTTAISDRYSSGSATLRIKEPDGISRAHLTFTRNESRESAAYVAGPPIGGLLQGLT
jgi:hypothetical protein